MSNKKKAIQKQIMQESLELVKQEAKQLEQQEREYQYLRNEIHIQNLWNKKFEEGLNSYLCVRCIERIDEGDLICPRKHRRVL